MENNYREAFRSALDFMIEQKGHGAETALSIESGVSQGHINKIKKGVRGGGTDTLHKLSRALETTYEEMLALGRILLKEQSDEPLTEHEKLKKDLMKDLAQNKKEGFFERHAHSVRKVYHEELSVDADTAEFIHVPVFNGGAGGPSNWTDEGYPVGYSSGTVSIQKNGTDENTFAVKIHGESMAPYLNPGDLVVVVPSADLVNGKLCFATWQDDTGEKLVKRYYRYGDTIVLRSDNPDKNRFPDIEINSANGDNVKIFRITKSMRDE